MPFTWIDVEFFKSYGPYILFAIYWIVSGYFIAKELKKGMFFSTIEYQLIGAAIAPAIAPIAIVYSIVDFADKKLNPGREPSRIHDDSNMHTTLFILGAIALMSLEVYCIKHPERTPAATKTQCVCKE